jgi:hypothetical protein
MKLERRSHKQFSFPLDTSTAPSRNWSTTKSFRVQRAKRRLLLALIAAGGLLAESAVTRHSLAQVSPFNYQLSKLRAESARLEREKDELIRDRQIESSRVASYNSDLIRIVAEFQSHIADQHHHFVSCKKCRQLTKHMSALSKKIERGVR